MFVKPANHTEALTRIRSIEKEEHKQYQFADNPQRSIYIKALKTEKDELNKYLAGGR
jgi:hypothetical protein